MTHTLLVLNALALSAVVTLGMLPADEKVSSLDYRTAMHARAAVMDQAPQGQTSHNPATPVATRNLSF